MSHVVQVKGGLGNQLFIYACGRGLADRVKSLVCYDVVYTVTQLGAQITT